MFALVTGANGFIGSHLTELLHSRGHRVRCLVRKTSDLVWLKDLPVEHVYGDLHDRGALAGAVQGVDTVFHLAGRVRARRGDEFFRDNHLGARNLLEACETEGKEVQRFILVSSMAAVGPSMDGRPRKDTEPPSPVNDYGRSKLRAEEETRGRAGSFHVGIARPPAVYGPRDWELFDLFSFISRVSIMPKPAGRDPLLSMIYVKDLAEGILSLAEREYESGSAFFFSDGRAYHWSELGKTMAEALGKRATVLPVPVWGLKLIAIMNESLARVTGKPAMLTRQKVKELLAPGWWCDSYPANQVLGFAPRYDFAAGSRETVDWYRSVGRL
jgi:nucleoside-diphosphate-sugar epimerase